MLFRSMSSSPDAAAAACGSTFIQLTSSENWRLNLAATVQPSRLLPLAAFSISAVATFRVPRPSGTAIARLCRLLPKGRKNAGGYHFIVLLRFNVLPHTSQYVSVMRTLTVYQRFFERPLLVVLNGYFSVQWHLASLWKPSAHFAFWMMLIVSGIQGHRCRTGEWLSTSLDRLS